MPDYYDFAFSFRRVYLKRQGQIAKATGHSTKLEYIQVSCRDAASDRDLSIITACVEITKEYNEAMSKLFFEDRNIVEDILY
jgi:hypothetical protein